MPPDSIRNPGRQFAMEFAPVANLSTVIVGIGRDVQADVVLMANATFCQLSIDIGYNFWGTRGGCARCPDNCQFIGLCDPDQKDTWALKGDARVFGFVDNSMIMPPPPDDPIPLSATQNLATIRNGTNQVALDFSMTDINPAIDNPLPAILIDDPQTIPPLEVINKRSPGNQINTSVNPIFLKCADIDFSLPKSRSHKFFAHVGFNYESDRFVTHAGIGVFYESGTNRCATTHKKKTGCGTCCKVDRNVVTPTTWGIWIKGGASFN